MVARHETPGNVLFSQELSNLLVLLLPPKLSLTVPGVPTGEVAGDGNEVRVFFSHEGFNQLLRLVIPKSVFAEVSVRNLHDFEGVV